MSKAILVHLAVSLRNCIVFLIENRPKQRKDSKPFLVAIVGGSGSGKTWLAQRLARGLSGNVSRVSLDNFYQDRSHLPPSRREKCNFDNPSAIDWRSFHEVLDNLASGAKAAIPCYDFKTHCRKGVQRTIQPEPVIIFDGLWLLRKAAIRKKFDLTIFVSCPPSVRLQRRIERDTRTRGRTLASIRRQFRCTVDPMHKKFVEPQIRFADVILGEVKPPKVVRQIRRIIAAHVSIDR